MDEQKKPLIVLDIGVLMGSQSNSIFQEMIDLYPGAPRVKEVIDSWKCDCNDPVTCSRKAFQLVLLQASHGDKDIAAKFIEEAAEKCSSHEEIRDLMVRYHDQSCNCHQEVEDGPQVIQVGSFEELQEILGNLFGGGTKH